MNRPRSPKWAGRGIQKRNEEFHDGGSALDEAEGLSAAMARDEDSGFGGQKGIDDKRSERDESERRPTRKSTDVDHRCQRERPVNVVRRVSNSKNRANRTGDAAKGTGEGKEAPSEGAG